MIRWHVLSAHIMSEVFAAKIAAVHHVGGGFRLLVTAFDPTVSVETQPTDRQF